MNKWTKFNVSFNLNYTTPDPSHATNSKLQAGITVFIDALVTPPARWVSHKLIYRLFVLLVRCIQCGTDLDMVSLVRISCGLMMTADMRWTLTKRLIFVVLVIALELTGMRLSAARWGHMVIFIPRWVVSYVIEVGMFRWTSGVCTSGGPILRQLCLDRLHLFLLSLVLVVDWYIPILNGQPSSTVVNFHITFNIVVVWAYIVSVRLGRFMKHRSVLPTT